MLTWTNSEDSVVQQLVPGMANLHERKHAAPHYLHHYRSEGKPGYMLCEVIVDGEVIMAAYAASLSETTGRNLPVPWKPIG